MVRFRVSGAAELRALHVPIAPAIGRVDASAVGPQPPDSAIEEAHARRTRPEVDRKPATLAPIPGFLNFGSAMRTVVLLTLPRARSLAVWTLLILALSTPAALAQDRTEAQPLRVGVIDAPPFSMKDGTGSWEGLSIEVWEAVAARQDWTYELQEYDSLTALLKAVHEGEVDLTPGLPSTLTYEVAMDLSHSYFPSGSGIAVPASGSGFGWLGMVEQLISWRFLRLILLLLLVWLTAGGIVWLFERRRNGAMFGDRSVDGLGNGIWWAAVTMTTVGYGDKAPRTLGGRTVAIVWMMTSVVLISGLTAAITTSLTLEGLSGRVRGVRDLPEVRVGGTAESSSIGFLTERGIAAQPFVHERDGLQAIVDGQIDAFVFNVLILRHLARTEFSGQVRVLPTTFDPYYIKMAMPTGSPLREPLNQALLAVTENSELHRRMERYVGSDH
jgi:polar amino acid transport system substrate-binding protein